MRERERETREREREREGEREREREERERESLVIMVMLSSLSACVCVPGSRRSALIGGLYCSSWSIRRGFWVIYLKPRRCSETLSWWHRNSNSWR